MNPSFEEFNQAQKTTKDFITGKYERKKADYRTPNYWYGCSVDYFHPDNPKDLKTPLNYYGAQIPHSGNCYMGIMLYRADEPLKREYLCGKLNNSLLKDSLYRLSFYLSLAEIYTLAVSNIAVLLSQDSLECLESFGDQVKPLSLTFDYCPQIINDPAKILKDKNKWMKVEGIYIATGNEKYIIIGNFDFDADSIPKNSPYDSSAYFPLASNAIMSNFQTVNTESNNPIHAETVASTPGFLPYSGAYYYIDDITLLPRWCFLSPTSK